MRRALVTAAFAAALSLHGGVASAQEPYIGEIRLFGYNWCPRGWAQANGALLSIAQNTALFSLYGTNFGGNGQTTFGLPNLSGRAPYGQLYNNVGQPFAVPYGQSTTTLTTSQIPAHTHQLFASQNPSDGNNPSGTLFATFPANSKVYAAANSPANAPMATTAIGITGGNQPVSTQSPALSLNWCVAMQGIFPSRN